jgi:hypothetical protein
MTSQAGVEGVGGRLVNAPASLMADVRRGAHARYGKQGMC